MNLVGFGQEQPKRDPNPDPKLIKLNPWFAGIAQAALVVGKEAVDINRASGSTALSKNYLED